MRWKHHKSHHKSQAPKWSRPRGRYRFGVACENIRFSTLFAAGDVSRAAKSEEKRMFSQASFGVDLEIISWLGIISGAVQIKEYLAVE